MRSIKGSALIIALMLVAIVQILLISVIYSHRAELRFTNNLKEHAENVQLLEGGIAWARGRLKTAFFENQNRATYVLPKTKINHREIETIVYDLQGRVNINSITSSNLDGYKNFFKHIFPKWDEDRLKTLLEKHLLSEDPASEQLSNSNLQTLISTIKQNPPSNDYTDHLRELLDAQNNSLNTDASQNLISITELLEKDGLTPQEFITIQPYLYTGPTNSQLNINSANPLSWLVLNPTLTISDTKTINQVIQQAGGFHSVEDFMANENIKSMNLKSQQLTVLSSCYLVVSTVYQKDIQLKLYALLEVVRENNIINITTRWQSFGTF